jgi:hypothetical protein
MLLRLPFLLAGLLTRLLPGCKLSAKALLQTRPLSTRLLGHKSQLSPARLPVALAIG